MLGLASLRHSEVEIINDNDTVGSVGRREKERLRGDKVGFNFFLKLVN